MARVLTIAALLAGGVAAVGVAPPARAKDAPARAFDAKLDALLINAVLKGDAREVRKLLGRRANPNARQTDSTATTALGLAAPSGNLEIVKLLVEAGANLEDGNALKQTPLLLATLNDRADVIATLVQSGAKVDSTQYSNMTALMLATVMGHTNSMRMLLRVGADVNARASSSPDTALLYATTNAMKSANLEVVQILVEAGANLFAKDGNGLDPYDLAKKANLVAITNYLVDKRKPSFDLFNASIEATLPNGDSPKAWSEVRRLLDGGAKGYLANTSGVTALINLSIDTKGFDESVAKRLIAVSDINAQENQGYCALHFAVGNNNEKMVALLIAAGANLSLPDKKGRTPLDVVGNKSAIATMLRNAGAQSAKTAVAAAPQTPAAANSKLDEELSNAVDDLTWGVDLDNNVAKVEQLLNAGASGRYADKYGETTLMLASKDWLPLKDEVFKTLIARSDINAQNVNGMTALHFAALGRNVDMVKLLIAAGANFNLRTKSGSLARALSLDAATEKAFDKAVANRLAAATPATPPAQTPATPNSKLGQELYNAIYDLAYSVKAEDYVGKVKKLLDAGASGRYADEKGKTALMLASKEGLAGEDEIFKTLITRSDINAQNEDGDTALHFAVRNKNRVMVELLVAAGASIDPINKAGKTALMEGLFAGDDEIQTMLEGAILKRPAAATAATPPASSPVAPPAEARPTRPARDRPAGDPNDPANLSAHLLAVLLRTRFDPKRADGLLAQGADTASADAQGQTLLMLACARGPLEAVQWLLSKKVAVNAADARGMTALMVGATRADDDLAMKIVESLAEGGADLKLKNKVGKTALDLATASGNSQAAASLKKAMNANG